MPDITMCTSCTCPLAAQCRRNEASGTRASQYQSWAHFGPDGDDCNQFWPVQVAGRAALEQGNG